MKINIRDMFDNFSDERLEIKSDDNVSYERVLLRTMQKIEEDNTMVTKKKINTAAIIAAAITVFLSISAFAAAYQMLSPKNIALKLENYKLAELFDDNDTTFDLEPQISGDYTFQIMGIKSGKALSDFAEVDEDRSYIIGAISRTDGEKLKDFPGVMITPLVAGYKPWEVNACTINGGRSEFIGDDDYVDYFIFECDNVEIFADHTIYIAVYEIMPDMGFAPSSEIFTVNDDGSIEFSKDFKGAKALFTLPIDSSKANPEAVKKMLEEKDEDEVSKDYDIETDNESEDIRVEFE